MTKNDKLNQIIDLILPNLVLGEKIVANRKWYKHIDDSVPSQEYVAFSLMESNDLIEIRDTKNSVLTLSLKGYGINNNGGWLKHLQEQSDNNEYLIKKEEIEFENLKLQKENLEYQESIREKTETISELTRKNLKLSNFDIKYRLLIFIATFIIGLFTEYFTDFLAVLKSLFQQ